MIKAGIYITLFAAVLYTGFLFGAPYYNYKIFESDLIEFAKVESAITRHPQKFMEKVFEFAENSNIPVTEENIELHQSESGERHINITVEWSQAVDLFGIYQHTYNFYVDTRE